MEVLSSNVCNFPFTVLNAAIYTNFLASSVTVVEVTQNVQNKYIDLVLNGTSYLYET